MFNPLLFIKNGAKLKVFLICAIKKNRSYERLFLFVIGFRRNDVAVISLP
jgi:hypothetical protein